MNSSARSERQKLIREQRFKVKCDMSKTLTPSARADNQESHGSSLPERRQVSQESTELYEEDLRYGANTVISLFIPISLCMVVVVALISSVSFFTDQSKGEFLVYTPFHTPDAAPTTIVWESVANSFIMIGVISGITILLVLLYKYRCYKIIHGWLVIVSILLMFLFGFLFLNELLRAFNIATDFFIIGIILWNFGVVGMVCIHWKGPLLLQQAYLILMSALMALIFIKYLPDWTAWVILAFISIYDLIAVLCPGGPLRVLVETAQERNEEIFPALIYSSSMLWGIIMAEEQDASRNQATSASPSYYVAENNGQSRHEGQDQNTNADSFEEVILTNDQIQTRAPLPQPNPSPQRQQEDKGVKLGLGDFIFYSVLVGKASASGDWNTTLACFVAILIGLSLTLILLAIYRKALPALPISIAFGIIFYFSTSYVVRPFMERVNAAQIYL